MKKSTISILSLLMGIGLFFSTSAFAATVTWNGVAGDGLWSTATNWSTNATPTFADNVVIPSTFTVTLSSDAGKINKITVNGKLIITSTGILNVEQTAPSDPLVDIAGGEIQNDGTLTIKQTVVSNNNLAIKFSDGTAVANTKLSNTGTLTVDLSARAAAQTTACISFAHTTANAKTAQFVLGGTININVPLQSRVFELSSGNAIFDGTFSFGSTSDYKNWRFLQVIGGNFTFASTANISIYSGYNVDAAGTIASSNSKEAVFTNNGTVVIHGGSAVLGYAIYMNPQASNYNCTFTNNGNLTIDGSFPKGSIFISNGGSAFINSDTFNNQAGATLSITNTANNFSGTPSACIVVNVNQTTVFNNAGTINLSAFISRSMYFGNSNSTFNNTGTINTTKSITGNSTGSSCVINNNNGGVFNFNVADNAQLAISNTNKITFNNNSGGTISGRGQFGANTFFPQAGGILSPGGDSGVGMFTFLDPAMVLKGICKMNINGAGIAGTDYDQINTNQSGSVLDVTNVNVESTIGSGYSPANLDLVPLFSSIGTVTGTFNSVTAPSNWVANYTTSGANLLYDTSTGINDKGDFKGSVSAQGQQIIVNLPAQQNAQMQIIDFTGKIIMSKQINDEHNVTYTPNMKGIYFVRLVMSTGSFTQKVLLN